MQDGKYIIKKVRGHEVAVLFHPLINHCDIGTCKESRGETVSAGFFQVRVVREYSDGPTIDVSVHGRSLSLDLNSRGDVDAALIRKVLEVV